MTIDEFKEEVEFNSKCKYWFIDEDEIKIIQIILQDYDKQANRIKELEIALIDENSKYRAELDKKDKEIEDLKSELWDEMDKNRCY